MLGWGGWSAYDAAKARAEARALGWTVSDGPFDKIRINWKFAFRVETWTRRWGKVNIPTGESLQQYRSLIDRLKPKHISVADSHPLRDLTVLNGLSSLESLHIMNGSSLTNVGSLKSLTSLQGFMLYYGSRLTNVDELKELPKLNSIYLVICTGLTNVDGLKEHTSMRTVALPGCKGLTKETVAALQAALPNTRITPP
jgi:hypothetical protein